MRSVLFLVPMLLFASDPRPKPSDYPAHAESPELSIGAEYLVHSFSNGRQMFYAPDFLVVDTAVYPAGTLTFHPSNFLLRLTPQKGEPFLLPSQAAQFVGLQAQFSGAGMGSSQPRFPGDPGVGGHPAPGQPSSPADSAEQDREPKTPSQVAAATALPEGETHAPKGGFLYFPFSGKTKKIKSLELICRTPGHELVVKLF